MTLPPQFQPVGSNAERQDLPWAIPALIVAFSFLTVYCTYVAIHAKDVQTGIVYADRSLADYRLALEGAREFPYQWRLLGVYLVYAGERLTGFDPNAIDVVIKSVLLSISSFILFAFSLTYVSRLGALCAVAFYWLLNVAAFTDGYYIYYTNDYAMVAAWFGAVYAVRSGRYGIAAALTLVGSLAKETMMLVPILLAAGYLRKRVPPGAVVLAGLAFLVPTAFLRLTYRAPIGKWAWWDMVFTNVPFLQSSLHELLLTLKNNAKVALFFNVLWLLGARGVARAAHPFVKDLAITLVIYLLLAYPVIYIRELRHFLPLAILLLPIGLSELDRPRSWTPGPA